MKTLSLNIINNSGYAYSVYREVFEYVKPNGEVMLFRININTRYHNDIDLSLFTPTNGFVSVAGFMDIDGLFAIGSSGNNPKFKQLATEDANIIKEWVKKVFH